MTSVLRRDRKSEGRKVGGKCDQGERLAKIQSRKAKNHHQLEAAKSRLSPEPAENKVWPCQHLDFRLLESRVVRD